DKDWVNIEKKVIDSILGNLKLDNLINSIISSKNYNRYVVGHIIKTNQLIYNNLYFSKEDIMTSKQKGAYSAAMDVRKALVGKKNKLRAYEKRLISAITLKDNDRIQELLLHLSSFTQVKMNFLVDIFEDFDENKNLVYTFVNTLGDKKNYKENINEK
ncbi:MAG: hypothetical protein U9N34_09225, partial [Candidatus Cloacimonadota bacterium]|nr:hypothetical protein [Candidatus Cloacimonadota bacterium]